MSPISRAKIYSLPNNQWIVSYFDSVRKCRVQKRFSEECVAKEYFNKIRLHGSSKIQSENLSASVTEVLFQKFLSDRPAASIHSSKKLIDAFLTAFSAYRLSELTEIEMRSFLMQIRNENEYSERTMLRIRSRLEGFFKYLVELSLIQRSPLSEVRFQRYVPYRRKPKLISTETFEQWIRIAKGRSPVFLYPIFLLIRETGAKTSDILLLQWADIDFSKRTVHLCRSSDIGARSLPISETTAVALRHVPKAANQVFTSLEGRPIYMQALIRELRKFQRATGLDQEVSFRDLRHSFAVHFLQAGGSLRELQGMLGHESASVTEQLYWNFQTTEARVSYEARFKRKPAKTWSRESDSG